jgi:translation initiation factor IF-3
VRLIGADNEQLGILPNYEALRLAREAGLDLVEVAPNVRPPVCRLMDYGKWKYSQKKNVKKHHEQQTKEVRLRPKTDTHDREIKLKQAIKFFKRGDKVQFTMVFRGRERLRREVALDVFRSIVEEFGARVKVERPPSMDGRHMVMIMSAAKDAFDEKPATADERPPAAAAPASSPMPGPAAPPAPPPSGPVAIEPPRVQSAIG